MDAAFPTEHGSKNPALCGWVVGAIRNSVKYPQHALRAAMGYSRFSNKVFHLRCHVHNR